MAVIHMNVQYRPKPQLLLNAFLALFIMHDLQIGTGIHGFQRFIYIPAKHDAWVSVLIGGIVVHVVVFFIFKTLQLYGSADIFGIHHDVYGSIIGKVFNAIFIFYFLTGSFVVLENYIEVVQAWMFPEMPSWFLSLSLLLLVIYGVTGGIRVIVGICFFNVIITLWIVLLHIFPLKYADFSQLFPVFETSSTGILKGAYHMTLTFLGFEMFYILYPHFKEKSKVQKYAQIGALISTFTYLALMVISIVYFSPGQLKEDIWATLTLFKIVKIPFIERFEYVTVAYWMIIILPNLMFNMWAAIRGMERGFKIGEKKSLWTFSILLFTMSFFLKTRLGISELNAQFVTSSFYIAFCYPIFLYFLALIKNKWKTMKEQKP